MPNIKQFFTAALWSRYSHYFYRWITDSKGLVTCPRSHLGSRKVRTEIQVFLVFPLPHSCLLHVFRGNWTIKGDRKQVMGGKIPVLKRRVDSRVFMCIWSFAKVRPVQARFLRGRIVTYIVWLRNRWQIPRVLKMFPPQTRWWLGLESFLKICMLLEGYYTWGLNCLIRD